MVLGFAGFLTEPFNTHDLIIYRENTVFKNDIFMVIGQISVIIILLMVTPVKYNAYRISIITLITGDETFSKRT